MFKVLAASALVLVSASLAHANDSAYAKISVKAISPGSMVKNGKATKFYGANADQFFNMLPGIMTASEEDMKEIHQKYRHMAIVSGKNSINLTCSKTHYDEKTGKDVKNANGTECSITLTSPDTEGDSFDFEAAVCK